VLRVCAATPAAGTPDTALYHHGATEDTEGMEGMEGMEKTRKGATTFIGVHQQFPSVLSVA
jgi:hypothetical protein